MSATTRFLYAVSGFCDSEDEPVTDVLELLAFTYAGTVTG